MLSARPNFGESATPLIEPRLLLVIPPYFKDEQHPQGSEEDDKVDERGVFDDTFLLSLLLPSFLQIGISRN